MSDNIIVYGRAECVTFVDGQRVIIHKDEPWNADDPIVKSLPDFFTPDPTKVQSTVETATKAPGEKRTTARRGKSNN